MRSHSLVRQTRVGGTGTVLIMSWEMDTRGYGIRNRLPSILYRVLSQWQKPTWNWRMERWV